MTIRQQILKLLYPLLVKLAGKKAKGQVTVNRAKARGATSFYDLSVELNNQEKLDFGSLKGKKVLLVNTASDCGLTPQYSELQKLYEKEGGRLVILGFPANDFKEQEKGSDEEIAAFCSRNFGVSFPLARKSTVRKSGSQHPVFKWLSTKEENGWNDKGPKWNFAKYLVNEEGVLTHSFDPSVSPLSRELISAVHS